MGEIYQYKFTFDKVDLTINKGDRLLCTKDVILTGTDTFLYKANKTYTSEYDNCITDELGDKHRTWPYDDWDDVNWPDHFKKIPHPVETCGCERCEQALKRGKDYFDSVREEYGKTPVNTPGLKINETVNSLHDLLQYKNARYGSSGLEPISVLSKTDATTGLLQRADDKIARIKNSPELRKNDVADLVGYLILICVSKGWTNFDEFKD